MEKKLIKNEDNNKSTKEKEEEEKKLEVNLINNAQKSGRLKIR